MSYDDDKYDRELKEVGARVQKRDGSAEPMGGVIESFEKPQLERPNDYWKCSREDQEKMVSYWHIKWDDGSTERDSYPCFEDTELERSYRKAAHEAREKIEELLDKASRAISDAEDIANKYGVPFHSRVSPLGQSYFPGSTAKLYPDLDPEFVKDVTGVYHSEYGEEGWQHSAVCY